MDQNNLKALISLLDDDDHEVFNHVEQTIISLGEPIIPLLESEWESNFNPVVQKRIEELIHSLQFDALQKKLVVWKESEQQDLLEGMWLVATYQYPDLDFGKLKSDIEQIYYEAWLQLGNSDYPFDRVKNINDVLFGKLKFGANTKNFHSPGNSMINVVLETHKANPISLCVIYMLVARKLKLPIYGVNLPNLFILTYKSPETQFYINAFNKGLIFSKSDIDNYLSHLNINPNPIFYEPCSHRAIIKRVFRNLMVAFEKTGEKERVEEIKILLECVSGPDDADPDL